MELNTEVTLVNGELETHGDSLCTYRPETLLLEPPVTPDL